MWGLGRVDVRRPYLYPRKGLTTWADLRWVLLGSPMEVTNPGHKSLLIDPLTLSIGKEIWSKNYCLGFGIGIGVENDFQWHPVFIGSSNWGQMFQHSQFQQQRTLLLAGTDRWSDMTFSNRIQNTRRWKDLHGTRLSCMKMKNKGGFLSSVL